MGNQWKEISEHFPGKGANDVKNKFNSILKRKLRKIEKALGNKKGTYDVKKIQPLVLTKMLDES